MSSPFPGPTPPYNNPPIAPYNYQPSQFYISNISLGQTTTVTTTANHNYVIGQLCRLLIPFGFGCTNLNEMTGYVISIPSADEVVLNLNSVGITPFQTQTYANQPQILAVGSINTGAINANGINSTLTYVPGSFINISP